LSQVPAQPLCYYNKLGKLTRYNLRMRKFRELPLKLKIKYLSQLPAQPLCYYNKLGKMTRFYLRLRKVRLK
jgi:hypothetical protein